MDTNHKGMTPEAYRERLEEIKHMAPDATLLYEDPAVLNPEELASFPKPAPKVAATDVEEENQARPVSAQRSAVREGRNIVRTDTAPDPDGYM